MTSTTLVRYRMAVVLLTAALLATLTVALTGGDRADAVDGPVEVVYVATGRDFPDALAGSTLAVTAGAPMLTVEPRLPLPPATIAALEALDPNLIIVFGGPGAVPSEVTDALVPYARSGDVTRIAGDDRHDTAAQIADALPDRVADADLLDGLDSTDFLRTTDDVDAATVDGLDTRQLQQHTLLPTYIDSGAIEVPLGVQLPGAGTPYADYRFVIPPGPDTPIRASMVFSIVGDCDAVLATTGSVQTVDTSITFAPVNWFLDGESGSTATYAFAAGLSTHERRITLQPTDALTPGSPVSLRVARAGDDVADTCGPITLSAVTLFR